MRPREVIRLSSVLLVLIGSSSVARAQFVTSEPILNFRLPMFNDAGFKIWELSGHEGRYRDDNHIEITAVDFKIFSGDEANALQTEITTPLADVRPKDRVVHGPKSVRVVGQGFELFGEDWTYEDATKTVVVRKSVTLTLEGSIGDILK